MKNKERLFSKNGYDTELETLLDEKKYTDEAKSLVLNTFYKIENSYKDYQKTKQNVKSKNEIVDDIIETVKNRCNTIEILDPKEIKSKLYVDRKKKIIKTFPNEVDVLQAIYYIKTPFARGIENIFERAVLTVLERGMAINGVEIIRDFNGWSWNYSLDDNDGKIYNLIYQNLVMLIGENALEKIIFSKNLISNLNEKLKEKYGEKKSEGFMSNFVKLCALIYMDNSEKNEKEVLEQLDSKNQELYRISNKSSYISEISVQYNKSTKTLMKIDSLLNSKMLLEKKYSSKSISDKYGDIEKYKSYLVQCREAVQDKISNYKKITNPFEYVKIKENIQNDVKLLSDIKVCYSRNNCIYKSLVDLQKRFIDCLYKKLEVYELKKELIGLVFEYRYYNCIPIENKKVEDIKEIQIELRNIEMKLINKLCSSKVLERFSKDEKNNYEILKYIFKTGVIDLNKTTVKLENNGKKLKVNYFDENTLEYQKDLSFDKEDYKELLKKTVKTIKLFL